MVIPVITAGVVTIIVLPFAPLLALSSMSAPVVEMVGGSAGSGFRYSFFCLSVLCTIHHLLKLGLLLLAPYPERHLVASRREEPPTILSLAVYFL